MRTAAYLCLAAYLIFLGLLTLFGLNFSGQSTVMGLLALAAGVLLLIGTFVDWPSRNRPG